MIVKHAGLQHYESVWRSMQQFTQQRQAETPDELWVLEHHPIFTLGLNGKREHLLGIGDIPVMNTDRGGQVTYHGPGQVIVYTLLDIKRLQLNIRELVTLLEQAMISSLADYGIMAIARADAPGVYVDGKKIGSIGLRIKNNCCYHGLSLNNNMDLSPFERINPCGYANLKVTQVSAFGVTLSHTQLANSVIHAITTSLIS